MALKDFERFTSSDDDIIYNHTKSRITQKIIPRGVSKEKSPARNLKRGVIFFAVGNQMRGIPSSSHSLRMSSGQMLA